MTTLYGANSFERFWQFRHNVPFDWLQRTVAATAHVLPATVGYQEGTRWEHLMQAILGEGQFGARHWDLSSTRRLYYQLRFLVPQQLRPVLRRLVRGQQKAPSLGWPVEDRYVRFLYGLLEGLREKGASVEPAPFWPMNARFAFVLTHDVETVRGQAFARTLADVDDQYGFRSSFNLVPEPYRVDTELRTELRERGFEVGVHGLKHDGRLFSSRAEFERRAHAINQYLKEWGAVGFRSPFTHRNPEWMQSLEIEYDSSFFDTDPFETIPGGTMSIWPFFCGRFVELPYTLMQDHTLFEVFGHTPQPWLDKVDFIAKWGGMALLNVHPDYMRDPAHLAVYKPFLERMSERIRRAGQQGSTYCWHALPRDVARWWRKRAGLDSLSQEMDA